MTYALERQDIAAPPQGESAPVPVALIPRAALFGNPERMGAQISPDGRHLSWIAPVDGVLNIWVADIAAPEDARPVTRDVRRGIRSYRWTYRPGYLLFMQDEGGDENWHVHGVDIATGDSRDLTPFPGVQATISASSRLIPDVMLVAHNRRDPRYPDLYLLDLTDGALTLVLENPGFAAILSDELFMPRIAHKPTDDGGSMIVARQPDGTWRDWIAFSPDDTTGSGPLAVVADGSALLMRDSRGRDTSALVRIALGDDEGKVLAADPRVDIAGMIPDLTTREPLAYVVIDQRVEYHALDDKVAEDISFLDARDIGEWGIASRSADDRHWVIEAGRDVAPGTAWLYDREARTLSELYKSRPALAGAPLAPMTSHRIAARDGLSMVSYLTLPPTSDPAGTGIPAAPVPLVLDVHGGPHSRDTWGYNPTHQWLANRGYAVLSVNFRGSSGFGKAHYVAALGEWGGKMDDDLRDAVAWAIARGVADPARVAIMGGSYGGYATLVGLTRDPEVYACGVDVVGPSNLETLLAAVPPYWQAGLLAFYRSVGDPRTEEGRALLRERSPLHRAGAIVRPLLIAQGANDPRVKQAEADQMVAAMKANGVPVTYVLFPDEGHGFARAPNRTAANAVIEAFLADHLGGRREPIHAAELAETTMQVREGADAIADLAALMDTATMDEPLPNS